MIKLLSGNEALALGAYHAGIKVAASYPGTPSTEILEALARHDDIYVEWSTNEKVAMEVALGAAYAGVRSVVSMKQVGLNVASDTFMLAALTGINAGMVVITAGDPGIHSSQDEQDNRHYVKLAKVPMLEPSDSQEAYELTAYAFDISEKFDIPVLVYTTTRISHSKSVVRVNQQRVVPTNRHFEYEVQKLVLLPAHARRRQQLLVERLGQLAAYAETFPLNQIWWGEHNIGIVTSGVAYQYAREVFPKASFLKLGMSYPLPQSLLRQFATQVEKVIVIEELDPFLQENIESLGIKAIGKEFIPRVGELTTDIIEAASRSAGLLPKTARRRTSTITTKLPERPPMLCPGCPHTGIFFVLSTIGRRFKPVKSKSKTTREPDLIITGDIGCYTLAARPPFNAMDTQTSMGASIGTALGFEKAGVSTKVIAMIGDSTFLHAGIPGLVNAVYNQGHITLIIMDNGTTAMTGRQDHPGTGISAQGKKVNKVELEQVVRGVGVSDVKVVDAFNLKALRDSLRSALNSPEISVIIVRGACTTETPKGAEPRAIDKEICNLCGTCMLLSCAAIRKDDQQIYINPEQCMGDACGLCQQVCPHQAIVSQSKITRKGAK